MTTIGGKFVQSVVLKRHGGESVGATKMFAVPEEIVQDFQRDKTQLNVLKRDPLVGKFLNEREYLRSVFQDDELSTEEKIDKFVQSRGEIINQLNDWVENCLTNGVEPILMSTNDDDNGDNDDDFEKYKSIMSQFTSTKLKNAAERILRAILSNKKIQIDSKSYDVHIPGVRTGMNLTDILQEFLRPTHLQKGNQQEEISPFLTLFLKELARNSTLGVKSVINQNLQQKFKQFRDAPSSLSSSSVVEKRKPTILIEFDPVRMMKRCRK